MSNKPKRTTLNLVVDLLTLALMLGLTCTGLVIRYVLPPGSGGRNGGFGLAVWGLDRHQWGGVHFWLAVTLVGLLLLHVAMHWSWVCAVCFRWSGRQRGGARRIASGSAVLLGLAAIVAVFTWCTDFSVERRKALATHEPVAQSPARTVADPSACASLPGQTACVSPAGPRRRAADRPARGPGRGPGRGFGRRVDGVTIRGHMTLGQVAGATGVPAGRLKAALGLPASAPEDERLGRLRRRYGFTMEQLRRAVGAQR